MGLARAQALGLRLGLDRRGSRAGRPVVARLLAVAGRPALTAVAAALTAVAAALAAVAATTLTVAVAITVPGAAPALAAVTTVAAVAPALVPPAVAAVAALGRAPGQRRGDQRLIAARRLQLEPLGLGPRARGGRTAVMLSASR